MSELMWNICEKTIVPDHMFRWSHNTEQSIATDCTLPTQEICIHQTRFAIQTDPGDKLGGHFQHEKFTSTKNVFLLTRADFRSTMGWGDRPTDPHVQKLRLAVVRSERFVI